MKERISPLISLSSTPRFEERRSELGRRFHGLTPNDVEEECVGGLHEWLAQSCVEFLQPSGSGEELVESMAIHGVFGASVLFLEALVDNWATFDAARERHLWLETLVDLLSRVAASKEDACSSVEDDLVASFLLCSALWNERRGRPLLETAREEVFVRSELYPLLVEKASLEGVVEEVRRSFRLS